MALVASYAYAATQLANPPTASPNPLSEPSAPDPEQGLVHLEALSRCESARAVIISNPTVSKAEEAAVKYKLDHFTGDADAVINHPEVEAVWICSPSQFHADQIKACAAAGKHVFCEKPIATDLQETVEAINACNEAGVKLMTALQRRFDPNFRRVKEAIEQDEVGEIVHVKLCSRDPAPPPFEYVKGGGGIFKDMAVHDLDMARFLMESEPVEVLARGSCQIDPAIEALPGPEAFDTATILIHFANGKDAMIDVCRQAPYGYDQRAEVLGKKGMIRTDNNYPNTARLYTADFTGNADMPFDFFMSRYKEAYVQETLAFVDCLVNDKPSPCSGKAGLIALVMAIAAGRSAQEKRWVTFAEMAGELCAMGDNDACAMDVVDGETGAINFLKLLSPMMGIVVDPSTASAAPASRPRATDQGEATRDPAPTAYAYGRRVKDEPTRGGAQPPIQEGGKPRTLEEYLAKADRDLYT